MFQPVGFAPRQKLPPGYKVGWSDITEMYHWCSEGDDGVESVIFCNRWRAFDDAWKHYREHSGLFATEAIRP